MSMSVEKDCIVGKQWFSHSHLASSMIDIEIDVKAGVPHNNHVLNPFIFSN
jgi:hypothetical protein